MGVSVSKIYEMISAGADFLRRHKDSKVYVVTHIDADGLASRISLVEGLKTAGYNIAGVEGWSWPNQKIVDELMAKTGAGDLIIFADLGTDLASMIDGKTTGQKVLIIDHHDCGKLELKSKDLLVINPRLLGAEPGCGSTLCYAIMKALVGNKLDKRVAVACVVGAYEDHEDITKGINKIAYNDAEVESWPSMIPCPEEKEFAFVSNSEVKVALYDLCVKFGRLLPPANPEEFLAIMKEISAFLRRKGIDENTPFSRCYKILKEAEGEIEELCDNIVKTITSKMAEHDRTFYIAQLRAARLNNYMTRFGKSVTSVSYIGALVSSVAWLYNVNKPGGGQYGEEVLKACEKFLMEADEESISEYVATMKRLNYETTAIALANLLDVKTGAPTKIYKFETDNFIMFCFSDGEYLKRTPGVLVRALARPQASWTYSLLLSVANRFFESAHGRAPKNPEELRYFTSILTGRLVSLSKPDKYLVVGVQYRLPAGIQYWSYKMCVRSSLEEKIDIGEEPPLSMIIEEVIKAYGKRHRIHTSTVENKISGGGHSKYATMTVFGYYPSPPEVINYLQAAYDTIKHGSFPDREAVKIIKRLGIRNISAYYYILYACSLFHAECESYEKKVNELLKMLEDYGKAIRKIEEKIALERVRSNKEKLEEELRQLSAQKKALEETVKSVLNYGAILPYRILELYQRDIAESPKNVLLMNADFLGKLTQHVRLGRGVNIYHYLHTAASKGLLFPMEITVAGHKIVHYAPTLAGRRFMWLLYKEGLRLASDAGLVTIP